MFYSNSTENFCNENKKDNDKKEEPTKEEKPDSPPELAPNKEFDFIIQPLSNDNKEDSPKPEDSPTVQDVISDVQDFAAAIEDHLDNKEEEE